jgi:hypothetical protein
VPIEKVVDEWLYRGTRGCAMDKMNTDKSYRNLLDYFAERNREAYGRVVDAYSAAGLAVPQRLGAPAADVAPETDRRVSRLKALSQIVTTVGTDFDTLVHGIERRARTRGRLKLGSAAVGAVSSSTLIGLLGTDPASTGAMAAAVLALGSSLLTVFADYLGVPSSAFWDGLKTAAVSREKVAQILLRIDLWVATNVLPDDPQIEAIETEALQEVTALRGLSNSLKIHVTQQATG